MCTANDDLEVMIDDSLAVSERGSLALFKNTFKSTGKVRRKLKALKLVKRKDGENEGSRGPAVPDEGPVKGGEKREKVSALEGSPRRPKFTIPEERSDREKRPVVNLGVLCGRLRRGEVPSDISALGVSRLTPCKLRPLKTPKVDAPPALTGKVNYTTLLNEQREQANRLEESELIYTELMVKFTDYQRRLLQFLPRPTG
eukprot:Sspe_Gene.100386::Locus_75070_Transcript_1_1_Confidence_1.000_Length_764::g.100386::m.100386